MRQSRIFGVVQVESELADPSCVGDVDSLGLRVKIHNQAAKLLGGSQRRNFLLTFAMESLILVSGLLTLQLAGYLLGTIEFGAYAVSKRAMNIIAYPLLLGLGTSMPRYVALSETSREMVNNRQRGYFFAGLATLSPVLCIFCIVVLLLPSFFAQAFFGEAKFDYLLMPLVLLTAGVSLHTLLYGYLRGRLQMWSASILQFVNIGLVPPLAIILAQREAPSVLSLTGVGWLVISLGTTALLTARMGITGLTFRLVWDSIRDLLWYGLPRVPGEFALFGLFSIPTFIIASRDGIEAAGFFSLGVSILQLIGGLFRAVGILLLPYVSRLTSQACWDQIRNVVSRAVWLSLGVTLLAVVLLQLTLATVIPLFMGSSFAPAVPMMRWFLLGSLPYVLYTILRNPLDAITEWPHNMVNLVISVTVTILLVWLRPFSLQASASVALALSLLGVLSAWSWWRGLADVIKQRRLTNSEPLDEVLEV